MKIQVLHIESVCDYEVLLRSIKLFADESKAKTAMKQEALNICKLAESEGYKVNGGNVDTRDIEAYEDGYAAQNHCFAKLDEVELEISCEELYRIARRQEEAEFKAKVKELYEAGKFVHKPYSENGKREEEYDQWEYELEMEEDSRPVLLANFDEGPDNVRIDKIVVHGSKFEDGWVGLEGESSRNYGCEYAFSIDDLEHEHLSYLTCEL